MKHDCTGCAMISFMENRKDKRYTWKRDWHPDKVLEGFRAFIHDAPHIVEDGDEFIVSKDCTVLFWGKIYQKTANIYKCYINGADENFTITINRNET